MNGQEEENESFCILGIDVIQEIAHIHGVMKTTINYSSAFAESLWLPFPSNSKIGKLICDSNSKIIDFLSEEENWISQSGEKYSRKEMQSLWGMIREQKKRVAAWWLVDNGQAKSFNDALKKCN